MIWTRWDERQWYASTEAQEFAALVDLDADGWHASKLDDPSGYPVDRGVFEELGDAMRACGE